MYIHTYIDVSNSTRADRPWGIEIAEEEAPMLASVMAMVGLTIGQVVATGKATPTSQTTETAPLVQGGNATEL
jgi:hypothetical protein